MIGPQVTYPGLRWFDAVHGSSRDPVHDVERDDGNYIHVGESRAPFTPHIWVTAHHKDGAIPVHLTLEAAADLRDQLSWLIEHHYQNSPA
jgi:hypothetical protein